jgi:hypothetical protein
LTLALVKKLLSPLALLFALELDDLFSGYFLE